MTLPLGANNVTDMYLGAPVQAVYLGPTRVWTRAAGDNFDQFGWLAWLNELCAPDGLIHDPGGTIMDNLGNTIGYLTNFVEGGINQVGTLVSTATQPLYDAYCGMWGASAPPDGLIGLLNGIPIIGGAIADWLKGDLDIASLIGQIPIIGALAQMLGVLPNQVTGALAAPINYITDAVGGVIATLSCGQFTATGGIAEAICYIIGIAESGARMGIPDGLIALPQQIAQFRFPDVLPADDGYLQTMVASKGDSGYSTTLFRRYANDGNGETGVGIGLADSTVGIVRRVGGEDTTVAAGGAFTAGDVLRLIQAGDVHTLQRNGTQVAQWVDGGASAARGAGNRSMGLVMEGAKDHAGPRRFSPGLAYAEAV